MGEFQTLHLCENPPHAPANSNFYPYIDSVCIGFQISYSTETWSFLLSVLNPIYGPTFLGFLSSSLTTYLGVAGARLASSCASEEWACMREGQKAFSHNALVRLVNLNVFLCCKVNGRAPGRVSAMPARHTAQSHHTTTGSP